jgi:hypothetical protein
MNRRLNNLAFPIALAVAVVSAPASAQTQKGTKYDQTSLPNRPVTNHLHYTPRAIWTEFK